ncbi:MAG TPA: tRNA(Ile)(2)-agmatinylcytidine synthase [Conexivisphaerales archaeon]|nr:tRNA(Ile)(2)-agmatinylcytidine synthase [Conexivisphaerales archaeon]
MPLRGTGGSPVMLHVGIDDTDSSKGMCTTYLAAVLIDEIKHRFGLGLAGFPRLIRLNPNCPFKTRGNAALSFRLLVPPLLLPQVKELVLQRVGEMAMLDDEGTESGVAFYLGDEIPPLLGEFSSRVVKEMVTIEEADQVARQLGIEVHKFKLGRGIIGALAAIGNRLEYGRTYELIAYRTPEFVGTPRKMEEGSIVRMNDATHPFTFDNLDTNTGEVRIMPHTPCPVYFGIRAFKPQYLERAFGIVEPLQPVERFQIYETNQGTDAHISDAVAGRIRPLTTVKVSGTVASKPRTIRGGHVIFHIKDDTGSVDCAIYEPTRGFRDVGKAFLVGDVVRVYGGVKEKPERPLTVNVEKLEVLSLVPKTVRRNPRCPRCGKTMKSEGKGKGYQCPKCKFKSTALEAEEVPVERGISLGLYAVPPRARRHLSKPATPSYEV